tara:strand:- start:5210 stop:5482 length:273 start_codon:yes stop_codon:yes gene_type:complete
MKTLYYFFIETPLLLIQYIVLWFIEPRPLNLSKLEDIKIDGIDNADYPDFCDAFICYATYKGKELTDGQYDEVNDNSDFVYEQVMKELYG